MVFRVVPCRFAAWCHLLVGLVTMSAIKWTDRYGNQLSVGSVVMVENRLYRVVGLYDSWDDPVCVVLQFGASPGDEETAAVTVTHDGAVNMVGDVSLVDSSVPVVDQLGSVIHPGDMVVVSDYWCPVRVVDFVGVAVRRGGSMPADLVVCCQVQGQFVVTKCRAWETGGVWDHHVTVLVVGSASGVGEAVRSGDMVVKWLPGGVLEPLLVRELSGEQVENDKAVALCEIPGQGWDRSRVTQTGVLRDCDHWSVVMPYTDTGRPVDHDGIAR